MQGGRINPKITGIAGTVNGSTHFLFIDGRYRLITHIEAERLQGRRIVIGVLTL